MTIHSLARGTGRRLEAAGGFLSRRRNPRLIYLIAFFLPVLIIGIMWAVCGVIPFGSKMILAHDQWHQYYPFFLDLRARLQNGNSLFHSWTTGMGINYLSLFAYYLASPLNLPAFLLPEGLVMPYYTLTVLVRLGLAGLFFALFLKKTFGREELTLVFFSTAYALCAFFMGYYWNAIWLDTVALLPLVVLGTVSLLRDRRYVLYVVSLALSVYCSYYIGLFVCIFVLLLFIGYHVVNWDDMAGFWTRFFRIGFFTLIALGLTTFLTLPAYLALQSTSSAVNQFPAANAMNIVGAQEMRSQDVMVWLQSGKMGELFSFFGRQAPTFQEDATVSATWMGAHEAFTALKMGDWSQFFAAFRLPLEGFKTILSNTGTLTEPTTMEGLPNIFCGFSSLLMAIVYLFCRRIPRRERFFAVFLLLFFASSFLFRTLDYIWHGLHFPNMLPHRFSFLWSFVILYMAYRAYTQLEHLTRARTAVLLLPAILAVYCVVSGAESSLSPIVTTLVALFVLGLLLFYSFRVIQKELFTLGLCLCLLAESLGCAVLGVQKVGVTDSSYYPTKKEATAQMVTAMKEREAETVDLWRAEVAMKQSLNDGTLLGYNGISCFSSAANSRISRFLQSLGLAASVAGNRYVYQEADPFTNLLLGLKYLIDRNGRIINPDYFTQVGRSEDVILMENRAYLSLGFMVRDNALEYDASQTGGLPYDRLNRLFRQMTGLEGELFTALTLEAPQAVGTAEITSSTSTSISIAGSCDEDNYVESTLVMPRSGHLCWYSLTTGGSDVICFVNGERQYTYSDAYGYNRYMGYFHRGDRISLRFRAKADKTASVTLGAALFDSELFDAAYSVLAENSMIPTLVSDTQVEGAVRVREAGLLYLSIPYDNGWTMTVDGEPARITPLADAMIAVHLEPGLHAIRLDFETPGFSLGLKISVICLAALMALLILALLSRFSRPPIVKLPVELADPRSNAPEADPEAPPAATALPNRSADSMPPLDLTQTWKGGQLPESVREELYGHRRPAEEEALRSGADPAPEKAAPKSGSGVAARSVPEPAQPDSRTIYQTGVFDPTSLFHEGEPGEAFNELKHLEALSRLLKEDDSKPEE